jgi:hypothetical protein
MEQDVKERVSITDTRVLTEDNYQTLKGMLGSNDEGNHKMAQLILNQLDIKESIFYIWVLAKHHANRMVNLRTKASRKFRDDCELFSLAYQNEEEFAQYLQRHDWLTEEHYQKLGSHIKDRIKRNHTNPFYNFHIKIKDQYEHLDQDDKLTPL